MMGTCLFRGGKMKRDQFTFYRSYYEALKSLPQKEQTKVFMAICSYALDEIPPNLSGVSLSVFTLIRPTLDSGRRKAENRKNKTRTKREQSVNEGEKEREEEGEEEREIEKDIYPPTPLQGGKKQNWNPPTFDEVLEAAKLRGVPDLARPFFDYYSAADWRDSEGKPVLSWQQKLVAWKVRGDDRLRKQAAQRNQPKNGNVFAEMLREEDGMA